MTDSKAVSGCGICAIIERVKAGSFRDFVAELPGCYVILGDRQYYRGYCVLLSKIHATEMYLMSAEDARVLFDEVRLVAEAIATVTNPWKMNYECLGNSEPHVHWHLFPRYETDEFRRGPIWTRAEAEQKVELEENDRVGLIASLRAAIAARIPLALPKP